MSGSANADCVAGPVFTNVLGLGGCIPAVAGAGKSISDAVDDYDKDQAAQKKAVEAAVTITDCRIDEVTGFGKASIEFMSPLDETKGYLDRDQLLRREHCGRLRKRRI